MKYPSFFNEIETIQLKDSLSTFLGAFEDGVIEFSFLDVVKSAGHSCPTVLGAYLMAKEGLKELYKDEIPKRGEIIVEFKENENEGVAGVISLVITQITGATVNLGFKGLAGQFNRKNLMYFESKINSSVRFTRKDNNKSVEVTYDASSIAVDSRISLLMQRCIQHRASKEETREFGILWQNRVENISKNIDQVIRVL